MASDAFVTTALAVNFQRGEERGHGRVRRRANAFQWHELGKRLGVFTPLVWYSNKYEFGQVRVMNPTDENNKKKQQQQKQKHAYS